jgi:hypothetical protein
VAALRLLCHLLGLPAVCAPPCRGLPAVLEAVTQLVADTFPATSQGLHR